MLEKWFDFYISPEEQKRVAVQKGLCLESEIPEIPMGSRAITTKGVLMLMVQYSASDKFNSDQRTFDILAEKSQIGRDEIQSFPEYLNDANSFNFNSPGVCWIRYNPYSCMGRLGAKCQKYPSGGGFYAGPQTLMAFTLFDDLARSVRRNNISGIRLLGYDYEPKPLDRRGWKGLLKIVVPKSDDIVMKKLWFDSEFENSCSGVYYTI